MIDPDIDWDEHIHCKDKTVGFAGLCFEHQVQQMMFESVLHDLGFTDWDRFHVDYYDDSIEFHDVENDVRLTLALLQYIIEWCKFDRIWLNHKDNSETYYHVKVEKNENGYWKRLPITDLECSRKIYNQETQRWEYYNECK